MIALFYDKFSYAIFYNNFFLCFYQNLCCCFQFIPAYIKLVIRDYLWYERLFIRQGILKSVLKLTVETVDSLDCLVQCNVIRNLINKFMKWIISSFSFDREETGGTWTIKWWKEPHNIQLNTTSWLWIFDLSSTKNHFLPLNRKRCCLRGWSRGVRLHYPTSTKCFGDKANIYWMAHWPL